MVTATNDHVCREEQWEKVCFPGNTTFEVNETNNLGVLGPFGVDTCHYLNISYQLMTGLYTIKLHPPDSFKRSWYLTAENLTGNTVANVTCSIKTRNETIIIWKLMQILENICTLPKPQDLYVVHELSTPNITKDRVVDNLLFLDVKPLGENSYEGFIINKTVANVLHTSCTFHPDKRNRKNGTIIHCSLTATKSFTIEKPMNFLLGLRNTNPLCTNKHNTGYMNVTLKFSLKRTKRSGIFDYTNKIFRTAAPYARITQPKTWRPTIDPQDLENFNCEVLNSKTNPFKITSEGILYVFDTEALKHSLEHLSLNISWTKKFSNQIYWEEINVQIVDEPTKTCEAQKSEEDWISCAIFQNQKSCMRNDSCGLGTGGTTAYSVRSMSQNKPHRCLWRGDSNPQNHETHLYSTCTSDWKYCPNGVCDSLEMLAEDMLCPQDCATRTSFPAKLSNTGRGVDKCTGILTCDDGGCTCHFKIPSNSVQEGKLFAKKEDEKPSTCNTECVWLISGVVALAVFTVVSSIMTFRIVQAKKLKKDKLMPNLPEQDIQIADYTSNEPLVLNFQMSTSLDPNSDTKSVKVETKWKFPRQRIVIEQLLGEGEFGRVLKAKAFNIAGKPGYSLVAVKTLKPDARKQDFYDLLSEYQLLKQVHHPHVIQLLGVCTHEDGPLYVIIEYASQGSLRNYLRKTRHIMTSDLRLLEDNPDHRVTPRDILSFARQIACGMSYLSDIKLVHRDLAARNILLSENRVCKISDFGLTRDIYEDNAYFKKSKGRVPVKWMAPESLADHLYTTKSDVWSYGILLWELVTLGATPYPGVQVENLYHLLKEGYRMEKPSNCATSLYALMKKCWNVRPDCRPSFLEIYDFLDNLLTDSINYLDLTDNAVINQSYFVEFEHKDLDKEVNTLENDDELNKFMGYEVPNNRTSKPINVDEYTDMTAKL
ncbi:hypothetical protein ABEB36_012584 [Hypothenemus hampei]|uniref:Protein kinase domain-containing protein n=1 Tax=Hypothenemus hampei TaxID=57062 RepID=A0ABD1ECF7_HYPHA